MGTYTDTADANTARTAGTDGLYSYAESSSVDMWDDFQKGDDVVAVSHHATCDPDELPVVRGEVLTFMVQHGHKYCKVKNLEGRIGFLPISHISVKERFHNESWYLEVCSKKLAEAIVNPEKLGSFITWHKNEAVSKIVIVVSAKTRTGVEHFEFVKKGRKLYFEDRIYLSLYHVIDEFRNEGILSQGINISFPNRKTENNHKIICENLILTGTSMLAKKNFKGQKNTNHTIRLRTYHTYVLIGTLRDLSWYVVRDLVTGVEGFAPAKYFLPLQPSWFHGEMSMGEIECKLRESLQTCSFIVAMPTDRSNCRSPYVLAVLDPQRTVQIFDIDYKSETVGCFNTVRESVVQLINGFLSNKTVPMLRYAVTNTDVYSVHSETTTLDIKSMAIYFKALEEGNEKDYDIRLMLVGHFGVGKTTVARRLLQEPIETVKSTEGIETSVKKARIDIHTGEWVFEGTEHEEGMLEERMIHIVRENSKKEDDDENETGIKSADGYDTITTAFDEALTDDYDTVFEPEMRRHPDKINRRLSSRSDVCPRPTTTCIQPPPESFKDLPVDKQTKITRIVKRSSKEGTQHGYISVWDFAGQFIYYATHQVFLATNAVYFLVLDLTKTLDELIEVNDNPGCSSKQIGRTTKSFIELWLQSIHANKDGEVGELPPVVLVGTHKDKLPCSPEDREKYISNYFESVRSLFDNSPLMNHIQPEQICLDNTIEGADISDLRNIVFDVAKRMPWWGKLKPAKWINLEQVLLSVAKSSPIVAIKDIIAMDKKTKIPVDNEEELRTFLRTQHNSGHVLFFEEAGLHDTIVLRPQWIIDAFKSIVLSMEQARRCNNLRPFVSEICEKAILHTAFIDQLWEQNVYKKFRDHKDDILLYLKKLGIITTGHSGIGMDEFYFVPSLLRDCDCDQELDFQTSGLDKPDGGIISRTPALFIKVDIASYHQSLFPSLLADCLNRWEPIHRNKEYKIYVNGGLFSLDKSRAHIMSIKLCFLANDAFYIVCKIANIISEEVNVRKCDEVRRFIVTALASHLHLSDPTCLELLIQCTHPDVINILGSLSSCETLDTYSSVGCYGHSSPFYKNAIDSRQLLSFWYPNGYKKNDYSSLKHWIEKSPVYVNDRNLADRDFEKLAPALGFGWEHIAISLGVRATEIDQCKLNFPQRTDIQIYEVLKKWKLRSPEKVTFLVFVKAVFENETVHVDWDILKNVGEGI